jgi:glutaconate CoA-transferase subunit A
MADAPRPRRMSVDEVVYELVPDGATVWIGNFGTQLFCIAREIIRSGRRDLHLLMASGGLVMDQLIGAGALAEATFAHCWGTVGPAPAWNFRRAAEKGDRPVLHELTMVSFNAMLLAGSMGVPFLPVPELAGTGHVHGDWGRGLMATARSEFGSSPVVRAVVPDVAFVFADVADVDGNCVLRGAPGEAMLAARSARVVAVVTEEIAGSAALRSEGISLPGLFVDVLVEQRRAVWPDGAVGRYDRDVSAYERYTSLAQTPEGFRTWLRETVAAGEPQ